MNRNVLKLGFCFWIGLTIMSISTAQKPVGTNGEVKVSGLVKGKPTGTSFLLANRKGVFTVRAQGAKVLKGGLPYNLANLTGGSNVSAIGKLNGMVLIASSVTVNYQRTPGAVRNPPGGTSPGPGMMSPQTTPIEPPSKPKPKPPLVTMSSSETGPSGSSSGPQTKTKRKKRSKKQTLLVNPTPVPSDPLASPSPQLQKVKVKKKKKKSVEVPAAGEASKPIN